MLSRALRRKCGRGARYNGVREERGCVLRLAGKATVMSYRRNAEKERLVAPEGKASDGGFRALALNGAELPRVLMLTVGFGLFRGWSVIGGSPTLFVPSDGAAFVAEAAMALAEDVAYGVLLLLVGVAALKRPGIRRETLMVASSAVVCAGTALFALPTLGYGDAVLVSEVGRVMFGAAACVAVLWGEQLCCVGIREALAGVAGAYALSYSMALVGTHVPVQAVALLQIALPAAAALCWFALRRGFLQGTGGETDDMARVRREGSAASACDGSFRNVPCRVLLGIGAFGAVLLLANGLSEGKTTAPDELLTLVTGLITSLAICAFAVFFPRTIDFTFAFRLMLPIIVACIFLVFFIEADQQPYEVAFIGFSWTFFIIFAWELWRIVASRASVSPLAVFAFGSVFLSVCSLAGEGLRSLARLAGAGNLVLVAVICVAAILVSTFLLNDQKVREAVQGLPPAFDRNDESACIRCVERASATIRLTEREREVAVRVLQGKDNARIVSELFITSATLYTHQRNMYKKAGVHSKQEFIDFLQGFA